MDINAYLARLRLKHVPAPDVEDLFTLQRAHRLAIPFENLDIALGRGISMDHDAIFDKLVTRRRGGYCFEQNSLFRDALTHLGFDTRMLLGRVWLLADDVPPRTHALNLVTLDGEGWIADVGFGASFFPPMRLQEGEEATGPDGVTHRLRRDADHDWMLECRIDGEYRPQYSFTTDRVSESDIAMSNHWTATWPKSRFVENVIASICLPRGTASLVNRQYSRVKEGEKVTQDIGSAQIMQMRLSLIFGIDLTSEEMNGLGLFD